MEKYITDFYELWMELHLTSQLKEEPELIFKIDGEDQIFERLPGNDVKALFYAMNRRVINGKIETNACKYFCGIVGCNELVHYNGHLENVMKHAQYHLDKINSLYASNSAPDRVLAMGVNSIVARGNILCMLVGSVSVNFVNSDVFAFQNQLMAMNMTRSLHKSLPLVPRTICRTSSAPIRPATVRTVTKLFADTVRKKLR